MPGERSGSRLKRLGAVLAVQLAALLLAFLAAEAFVRCWREGGLRGGLSSFFHSGAAPVDPGTKGFFVHDAELGYRLNPAQEEFNSLSFRGPEVAAKPPGRFRILLVGDSVAWERGGFGDLLAAELAERSGGATELLNAAVPGYTSYQERVFLGRLLPQVQPDLVVLEYCLNDNHRFLHRLTEDGGWLLTAEARGALMPEGRGLLAPLLRWSYLAFEVRKRLLARQRHGGSIRPWESEPDFGPAWHAETWPLVREQIASMHAAARSLGARFLVMAVPYEPQLDALLVLSERERALAPQARLQEICSQERIPFLDLAPDFEARLRAEPGTRLFRDKVHLTPEGHELARRRLAERLAEEGLLPALR